MSAQGYSFELNSVDYGGASYNVFVSGEVQFPTVPIPRVNVEPLAQADGVATQGTTYASESIFVPCTMKATSAANRTTKLGAIKTALKAAHAAGEVSLKFDAQTGTTYTVRWVGGLNAILLQEGATFLLEFLVTDPTY